MNSTQHPRAGQGPSVQAHLEAARMFVFHTGYEPTSFSMGDLLGHSEKSSGGILVPPLLPTVAVYFLVLLSWLKNMVRS